MADNTSGRSWKNSLDRSGYTILCWVFVVGV